MDMLLQSSSSIPDAVAFHKIILDQSNKPVDYFFLGMNDSFVRLTGLARDRILNRCVTEALPGIENDPFDWIGKYGKVALTGLGTTFESYAVTLRKWFRVTALCPEKGFFLTIFDDITDRKRGEEKRERLTTEPREDISERKHLKGILPICASCKNIRDDKGVWTQVESYISDHSEAEFSHGICPECAKKLYPELYDTKNEK